MYPFKEKKSRIVFRLRGAEAMVIAPPFWFWPPGPGGALVGEGPGTADPDTADPDPASPAPEETFEFAK